MHSWQKGTSSSSWRPCPSQKGKQKATPVFTTAYLVDQVRISIFRLVLYTLYVSGYV